MYMGVRKFGQFMYKNQKIRPFIYFLFKKGFIIHLAALKKGAITLIRTMSYRELPPGRDNNIVSHFNFVYYTAIRSLFRHVVCDVPVSCKETVGGVVRQ